MSKNIINNYYNGDKTDCKIQKFGIGIAISGVIVAVIGLIVAVLIYIKTESLTLLTSSLSYNLSSEIETKPITNAKISVVPPNHDWIFEDIESYLKIPIDVKRGNPKNICYSTFDSPLEIKCINKESEDNDFFVPGKLYYLEPKLIYKGDSRNIQHALNIILIDKNNQIFIDHFLIKTSVKPIKGGGFEQGGIQRSLIKNNNVFDVDSLSKFNEISPLDKYKLDEEKLINMRKSIENKLNKYFH